MSLNTLLSTLESHKIKLKIIDGQLEINGPKGSLTPEILAELRARKPELMSYLSDVLNNNTANTIEPVAIQESYELSHAQKRLWIEHQLNPVSTAYNIPGACRIQGDLNVTSLKAAFETLIERHESLRTTFVSVEGEPRQRIHDYKNNDSLVYGDLSQNTHAEMQIRELVQEQTETVFNLNTGPLLKANLWKVSAQEFIFALTLHHIISDGWSITVLLNEIVTFYEAYNRGEVNPSQPLSIHYKDFANWQQQQLRGEKVKPLQHYWHAQFSGEIPVLALPTDFSRPALKTSDGNSISRVLSVQLTEAVKQLSQRHSVTLFMTMLAALKTLFYKYTAQDDIIIGTPIAGRNHSLLEDQIGFYVNTLAIRTRFTSDASFGELLTNVKQATLGAYEHQLYPFDRLIAELQFERDMSRSPLFDVLVAFQNDQTDAGSGNDPEDSNAIRFAPYQFHSTTSKFDLSFYFFIGNGAINIKAEYRTGLFLESTLNRFLDHFEKILVQVSADSGLILNKIPILSVAEYNKIVKEFNPLPIAYEKYSLINLFETQVLKYPDAIAIRSGDRALTYAELNVRVNQLGHFLKDNQDVKKDQIIGLLTDRNEYMVIGMLAILKAGAAYLPLDPRLPIERIAYILANSQAQIVLASSEHREVCNELQCGVTSFRTSIAIDQRWDNHFHTESLNTPGDLLHKIQISQDHFKDCPTVNLNVEITDRQLVYIMFTSGSTGRPKGVMVQHGNVVNFMHSMTQGIGGQHTDRLLAVTTYTFDISVLELLWPLLRGAQVVIAQTEHVQDMLTLKTVIASEQPTHMQATPSLWKSLIEVDGLKDNTLEILCGGEPLTRALALQLHKRSKRLWNLYGPTETTIWSTIKSIDDPGGVITIGRAINNTGISILDDHFQPVPIGVEGELCISGDGLARGYINEPELTASRFIQVPFSNGEMKEVYRTGDRAKWLANGELYILGRQDDQVKIRGYRIELGEIENVIQHISEAEQVVVVAREYNQDDKRLIAYVKNSRIDVRRPDFREQLLHFLPAYMVPTYFVEVKSFTLTANGKVNKKVLPVPGEQSTSSYQAPGNEIERTLVEIWESVLARSPIGINDNFFVLGGHSLNAIQIIMRIYKYLNVSLELKTLFSHSTIALQAREIAFAEKTFYKSIQSIPPQKHYALSHGQRRLWIQHQLDPLSIAYNVPGAYRLRGSLDVASLRAAFRSLVQRHESLRTTFEVIGEGPRQVIHDLDSCGFVLLYEDLRRDGDAEEAVKRLVTEQVESAFDLVSGPLLRASLWQVNEAEYVFSLTMHHIISDGWSMQVLVNEVLALYESHGQGKADLLPPLRIQYKDYAYWQAEQLQGSKLEGHQRYWHSQFSDEAPVLSMASDYPRPQVKTYNGATVSIALGAQLSQGLKQLSQQQGVTLFMTLLAGVKALLYRYSGQEDIVVGTPVAGRDHEELENQIGFYVNMLALRTRFSGQDTFGQVLEEVKRVTLTSYEHQLYPFDRLIEELPHKRDISRSPLFDVVVVLQNTVAPDNDTHEMRGVSASVYEKGTVSSIVDLRLEFTELSDDIYFILDYNTDLFKRHTAQQFQQHFVQLMSAVLEHGTCSISTLPYLSQRQEQDILRQGFKEGVGYPLSWTIVSVFEQRVSAFKDSIAVVYEDRSLTYGELNARANQLAHCLYDEYGIQSGELVGLLCERSEDLLIGILGILKAGGAYLPLDPGYPAERLRYMLEDSGVRVVVSDGSLRPDGHYSVVELSSAAVGKQRTQNCGVAVKSEDLAYVIYTSGSTGQPKGVMIGHRQVVRLLFNDNFLFDFSHRDVWTLFHSVSFDFSVWEIFGSLLYGGKLVVISKSTARDASAYLNILSEHSVTVVNQVPSAFDQLLWVLEEGQLSPVLHVRYVIFGGEALHPSHLAPWRARYPGSVLVNMYGITETTVHVSYKEIGEEEIRSGVSNIGEVLPTLSLYLLDEHGQVVPVGVEGELYVGGAGLAQGYLNRPELTMERFVPNPFEGGPRLYKSGDRGRRLWDGTIEYLGRQDDQVKIRGYRIETGEIERALERIEGVEKGVVLVWADEGGDKQLIGYVQGLEDLDVDQVRESLRGHLPEHMIPSQVIRVKTFGLTSNGKLDKKSLPSPQALPGRDYVGARTEVERHLVAIWETVLSRQPIGVTDNFFALGGDSIKAIRIVAKVNKELDLQLEVKDLFNHQTIASLTGEVNHVAQTLYKKHLAQAVEEINSFKERISSAYSLPPDWEDFYPMSDIEKGMFYYTVLNPQEGVYHDQFSYQIEDASFNVELLHQALKILVQKHAILRSSFHLSQYEQPIQAVHVPGSRLSYDIVYKDISALSESQQQDFLNTYLIQDRLDPFHADRPCLWRLRIFQIDERNYSILWIFHHAILDGWSTASFITELSNVYYSLKEDIHYKASPLSASYKDYVIDQHSIKYVPEIYEYWKKQLENYKRTPLPLGKKESVADAEYSATQKYTFVIDESLAQCTNQTAQRLGISLKEICLSAFLYLIKITTNSQEPSIGVVANCRPAIDDGDAILGCFLNTIPFRVPIAEAISGGLLLEHVVKLSNEVKAYEKLSLLEIVKLMDKPSNRHNPLFDIIFNYVDFHIYDQVHEETNIKESIVRSFERTNTLFDFTVNRVGNRLVLSICTLTELYSPEEAERIAIYFQNILRLIVTRPDEKLLYDLILPEEELRKLKHFNNVSTSHYPAEKTVVSLFEDNVVAFPDRIAVAFQDTLLTYGELNARANQLAHYLREDCKVVNGQIVGLLVERNEYMVVGMLGILKAGGAYLPIDPNYPDERMAFMIEDSAAEVIVGYAISRSIGAKNIIPFSTELLQKYDRNNSRQDLTSRDLAYVMYTSGSTGRPKGVMIEHTSIARLVLNTNYISIESTDKILSLSNPSFDAITFDVYGALLNGAAVVLAPKEIFLDLDSFATIIRDYRITSFFITSSLFNQVVEQKIESLRPVKTITVGGEELSINHVSIFIDTFGHSKLVNGYGPTENTTFSCCFSINENFINSTIPIGGPISNTEAYILDDQCQLLPIGVEGEICLGGAGLSKGYLNRPELTADRFMPHPFKTGERLYKTGDRGRWLNGGVIEFHGRHDEQIKLRGFRIEPGEIERSIERILEIKKAVVLVWKDESDSKQLIAYLQTDTVMETARIRQALLKYLPDHMVPARFMSVSEFPLTSNGKLDREALPKPSEATDTKGYIPPGNALEREFVGIWETVLTRKPVGIADNFFELGGDSIKAIQVAARLNKAGYKLEVRQLLQYPVIQALVPLVQAVNRNISQLPVDGEVNLTPIQHYYFKQKSPVFHHYNQSLLLAGQDLSKEMMKAVFGKLLQHHDALRMVFRDENGKYHQTNKLSYPDLDVAEFKYQNESWEDGIDKLTSEAQQLQQSIDIVQGPLIKIGLFHLATGDRLLVAIHHLVVDGVSWRILLQDIGTLIDQYNNNHPLALPLKSDSYQKWAQELVSWATSDALIDQQAYWIDQEQKQGNVVRLVPDNGVENNLIADSVTQAVALEKELTLQLLTKAHAAYGTQTNDILIGALVLTLQQCYQGDLVLLGLEGHGREEIIEGVDITRTVGWFTSLYPLMLEVDKDQDISHQVIQIKEQLRQIPDKGLGYGALRYLRETDYFWRLHPQVRFNYLGQFDSDVKHSGLAIANEPIGKSISDRWERDCEWDLTALVSEDTLMVSLTYNQKQFTRDHIERFLHQYLAVLKQLIDHCVSQKQVRFTPSDFTYTKLPLQQLDALQKIYSIEDIYELSPMQEGLLFHSLQGGSEAYFEQLSYGLKRPLQKDLVKESFGVLLERHSVLRTVFVHEGIDCPLQLVLKNVTPDFTYRNVSSMPASEQQEEVVAFREQDRKKGFILSQQLPMRITLLQLNETEYQLIWSFHHIVMDGWCLGILIKEFWTIYEGMLRERPYSLAHARPYKDYIQWLRSRKQDLSVAYWNTYLSGYDQIASFPKQHLHVHGFNQQEKFVRLGVNRSKALQQLAAKLQVTFNTAIQTLWGILLSRYSNTTDVVFGSVVSGRPSDLRGVEEMVGLFINTIPVRVCYGEKTTLEGLLRQVQHDALDGQGHHYCQLAQIQANTKLGSGLLNHIIAFENYPLQEKIESIETENRAPDIFGIEIFEQTNYDLSVMVIPGAELVLKLVFNRYTYEASLMESLGTQFILLVDQLLLDPKREVHQLNILDDDTQQKLLHDFNDTDAFHLPDKTLIGLFEVNAGTKADSAAVVFEDKVLTYGVLNVRANQLAHRLRNEYRVGPGQIVGLISGRNEEILIGMAGILKTGAGYLPLDPEYPADRIDYMIREASVKVIVSASDSGIPEGSWWCGLSSAMLNGFSEYNLTEKPSGKDLAYVIYTSGSTGRPKGVMIEHASVVNTVTDQAKRFALNSHDRILQFSSISFDASLYEIGIAWACGATTVMVSKPTINHPDGFLYYLQTHNVDVVTLPPAYLNQLDKDKLHFIKVVITAGEAAISTDALACSRFTKYYNAYGPTESSICATVYEVGEKDRENPYIPIGHPISNTRILIADQHFRIAPVGVEGDIYIEGKGLARGYINQPALTADRFIAHPGKTGTFVYKTGDRGRWRWDGAIEYLGRNDDQVKIRGYRIELGEIERVLEKIVADNAIVSVYINASGDKSLVAYLRGQETLDSSVLRKQLSEYLPEYMIPAYFMTVDVFPTTVNGKIDKKALPSPALSQTSQVVHPRNETEQQLVTIWEEVLEKSPIGVTDNFFELGGHSLKVMRLVSRLRQEMQVKMEIGSIFASPTIESLSRLISHSEMSDTDAIYPVRWQKDYELSHAQRRLWIEQQLNPDSIAYNISFVRPLDGQLDVGSLQAAFSSLVARHESLRTTFISVNGEPRQFIHNSAEFPFHLTHEVLPQGADVKELIRQQAQTVFRLSNGPLLKANVWKLDNGEFVFALTMHHIISDHWSMQILIEEVLMMYRSFVRDGSNPLPSLRIQYKDYAQWHNQQLVFDASGFNRHESFWVNQLKGPLPKLNFNTGKKRPALKTANGSQKRIFIPHDVSVAIKDVSKANNCTPFVSLLSAVKLLLYSYTSQNDIIIGTSIAGRDHVELEQQIGLYLNQLAIRTVLKTQCDLTEFIATVRAGTIAAFDHKSYPIDLLLEKIEIDRDMSRSAIFDVMVDMENVTQNTPVQEEVKVHEYGIEQISSRFDLTFNFSVNDNRITAVLIYNVDIFPSQFIADMLQCLEFIIAKISEGTNIQIESLLGLIETKKLELQTIKQQSAIDKKYKMLVQAGKTKQ